MEGSQKSGEETSFASKISVLFLIVIVVVGAVIWVSFFFRNPSLNKNVAKRFTASVEKECLREFDSDVCQKQIARRHAECFERSISEDAESGYEFEMYRGCVLEDIR